MTLNQKMCNWFLKMNKFDDRKDRIEYQGTALVNAQRNGKCAWCGIDTVWYDMILREFLCSEDCVVKRHYEVSEAKLGR
jgi:hypothetical protein